MIQNKEHYNYFQIHQNSSLPMAMEYDSGMAGSHIMFVGSLHGHEPAGAIACVEVHQKLKSSQLKLKSGKVTFVLGNPKAFLDNQRFVNTNLNRAFLDDIESGVEGERALEFRNYFDSNSVDYLIDLHSVSSGDFKFVVYFEDEVLSELAVKLSPVGTHLIVNSSILPGSLMEEAARYGAKSLVFECGNNNDQATVEIAKHHITSALLYLYMIDTNVELPDIKPSTEICKYKVLDYIRPGVGFKFLNPKITTGSYLTKGQVYAKLGDGFKYEAKTDCYIVMPDLYPNPNDHDAGFLCSKETMTRPVKLE
ncbi:MAG: succinylglutamate desuccinylase/aspartoacylase family protein [Patescibacteria group bacterium]